MTHVHYDRAAILADYERIESIAVAAIRASTTKNDEYKALEVAAAPLRRAMVEFMISAKEMGIGHETVATVAGGALATLAGNLMKNYRCPCVPGRIVEAFMLHMAALGAGELEAISGEVFKGTTGGRA